MVVMQFCEVDVTPHLHATFVNVIFEECQHDTHEPYISFFISQFQPVKHLN